LLAIIRVRSKSFYEAGGVRETPPAFYFRKEHMKVSLNLELGDALDIIQFSENDRLVGFARMAIAEALKDAERRSSDNNPLRLVYVKHGTRIQVISFIRTELGWDLKEANDLVKRVEEGQPQILPTVLWHEANALAKQLQSIGCVVEAA